MQPNRGADVAQATWPDRGGGQSGAGGGGQDRVGDHGVAGASEGGDAGGDGGAEIGDSYSARYYNLSRLRDFPGRMVELGRFCIHPEWHDPDILRLAWGALAQHVDRQGVEMLFGCSSFMGTDTHGYEDAFAMLRERHLAPKRWLPRVKAPKVFRFARALKLRKPDPRAAMAEMASTPVAAGELTVRIDVTGVYDLAR